MRRGRSTGHGRLVPRAGRLGGKLVLAVGSVVALGGLLTGCVGAGAGSASADGKVGVVATTTVLADLVAQVGGERVRVVSLVPKGGEVHTFDPRPSDLVKVDDAQLIVMNGLGLDDWLARLATNVGTRAPVVVLGEGLPGISYIRGDDGRPNPHVWMDVADAIKYVDRIEAALTTVDPAGGSAYAARADAYRARLATLDSWVKARVAEIPSNDRAFVSFHDALPYYAAAYGLRVVGVVVPAPGQEPSAGEIAALVAAIRSAGVHAVFSEAQFAPSLAGALAAEAGASVVADLYTDTLGDAPVDTYEGLIRWDTDRFVEALR